MSDLDFSIVIPAKNEGANLKTLLPEICSLYPETEVIVVDDGSTDDTVAICTEAGVKVISHKYSRGNGASIKTGARQADSEIILFMDGDGQHKPEDISRLLSEYAKGMDMVVGARDRKSQASLGRLFANSIYNKLASWISGYQIRDLTSGFRIVNREKFLNFLYLLPNGFSYPTTSTMAFCRAGYSLDYIPIETGSRLGKSHINLLKDGIRFFIIIFKIGTLFSPLKIFLPISFLFFITGIFYYLYTYMTEHSFTNMGVLLFIASIFVFLIGLISEQITALIYKDTTD